MRLLNEYFFGLELQEHFLSQASFVSFARNEVINAGTDLNFEGNKDKELYNEMSIPDPYKANWWKQIKGHVSKRFDEKRSNIGAAVKKSIISKSFLYCLITLIICWNKKIDILSILLELQTVPTGI